MWRGRSSVGPAGPIVRAHRILRAKQIVPATWATLKGVPVFIGPIHLGKARREIIDCIGFLLSYVLKEAAFKVPASDCRVDCQNQKADQCQGKENTCGYCYPHVANTIKGFGGSLKLRHFSTLPIVSG